MSVSRLLLTGLIFLSSSLTAFSEPLIRFEKIKLEDKFYGEGAAIGDINKDGKNDIVYGPYWWEGPDYKTKHAYYEPKAFNINGYSDNFFDYVQDFNGDGYSDILVLGFPGKEARLYLNPGKEVVSDAPWKTFVVADVVDNESPEFTDLTGDGKAEIVCSKGGQFGYFEPDWQDVTKPWTWHPVTENVGVAKFTHGMGVGDVNGDGKPDLLEAKRWWEQPKEKSDAKWTSHTFQLTGGGGAQMYAYDFNGDGRNDLVSSLNAHQFGVAWFEQRSADTPVRNQDIPAGEAGKKKGVDLMKAPSVTIVDGGGKQQVQVVREFTYPTDSDPSTQKPLWQKHLIVGKDPWENEYGVRFSQPHAMALVDVDGDGLKDIITGKRYWAHNGHDPDEHDPRVLYWFQTKRLKDGKVEFVPHLIDSDSGVGTQLTTGDINGDGLVDVVVGNKSGCYVFLQQREEVSTERFAQFQPKKIYGPEHILAKDYQSGQKSEDAVKHMTLPAGFKAEVIAAEPDVVQPVAMCWDERGRLWVAEGNSYPQKRNGDKGPDRILIFEDTKGTGKFDKRTVFMEGLNLVSGLEVGFGGVWVGAAPQLLFIPKDADDKPGEPKVLLDGWGMQDTHETLNSFIWGPDGWLYGCHGVFTYSKVGKPGTPEDQRTPINAGVWRYHPVRHEFEVFAQGTSNPWGLDYNDKGEFFITACVIPHLYHVIPGARYQRQGGQHFNPYTYDDIKTIADHAHYAGNIRDNAHWGDNKKAVNLPVADDTDAAGGGHAHCGLCIYQGDNFPEEYRGELLFGNLHGHRLVHDHVEPKGSGYSGEHRADFMRSNDFQFIPIQQKVGPDGALYVSDWSDKQVCHQGSNAIDMWDRSNGRIYRISYDKGSAGTPARSQEKSGGEAAKKDEADKSIRAPFDLGKMSDEELVKLAVESGNIWFERMARRVLMERGSQKDLLFQNQKVTPLYNTLSDLREKSQETTDVAVELRVLWLLNDLGKESRQFGEFYNNRESEFGRAWGVRLTMEFWLPKNSSDKIDFDLPDFAKQVATEKSSIVRREVASALQRFPVDKRADIAKALLAHKEDAEDQNIPLLIWYGIEPLVGADAKTGMELAEVSQMPKVTGFIFRRLSSDATGREALLRAAAGMSDKDRREQILGMVLESARTAGKLTMPADWATVSGKLASDKVDELSALFGDDAALQKFRSVLADSKSPVPARERVIQVLIQRRDLKTAPLLQAVIKSKDHSLMRKSIQALASLLHPGNAAALIEAYASFTPEEKTDAVSTLASTADGAKALLEAAGAKVIESQQLTPFLVRQLQALNNKEVDALVARTIGTVNQSKADLPQRKAKFRALLTTEKLKAADPAQGKLIFSSTCGTCHRLFGEGASVGPDLTGSNRANLDYLLDNVLDPNAVIGKDYQLNLFTMKDGRVVSGIVKEESADTYRVVMPGGIEFSLTKAEVAKREVSKFSTMPEGQFEAMPPEMVVSLVAYLQSTAGSSSPPPTPDAKK